MEQQETFGLLRVAAASPRLRVADCATNAQHLLDLMGQAEREGGSTPGLSGIMPDRLHLW